MSRDDLHFRLRIPEDLKLRIEASSNESRRSMTAEIVARLEETFRQDDEFPAGPDHDGILEMLKKEISDHNLIKAKYLRSYTDNALLEVKNDILEAIRDSKK